MIQDLLWLIVLLCAAILVYIPVDVVPYFTSSLCFFTAPVARMAVSF